MRKELKSLFILMTFSLVALFSLSLYLIAELKETTARADQLAGQVYTLGSMLGEQKAALQAGAIIKEGVTYGN